MEYELTDIGPTAKPELIKSLGFNIDQGNTEGKPAIPLLTKWSKAR